MLRLAKVLFLDRNAHISLRFERGGLKIGLDLMGMQRNLEVIAKSDKRGLAV